MGFTFFFFCVPSYISGVHFLLLLVRSQLYIWGSPSSFSSAFPSYIFGVYHSSSSAFPAISLMFTILLLLLRSQLYLWGSPSSSSSAFSAISLRFTFFFCVPSCISRVHHSSSSSVFPSYICGVHLLLPSQLFLWGSPSSSAFSAISPGFTILLLLLRSMLYLWGSLFFFFFCVPTYISGVHLLLLLRSPAISLEFTFFFFVCIRSYIFGVHHSSSSSALPTISLGFIILLLLCSQLFLWSSPFFFFCVPSHICRVYLLLLLLVHSQLYLWDSLFFFLCVPSYISLVHHSSSSSEFPAMSLRFTILLLLRPQLYLWGLPHFGEMFVYVTVLLKSNHRGNSIPSSWMVHAGCVFVAGIHPSRTCMSGSLESVR